MDRLRKLARRLSRFLNSLPRFFFIPLLVELRSLALSGILWTLMIAIGSSLITYPIAAIFPRFRATPLSLGVGLVVFGGLSLAHAWRRDHRDRG